MRKIIFFDFSGSFQNEIWPISGSKCPKMVLKVPPVRYFDAVVRYHRFTGPLGSKRGKKLGKKSIIPFLGQFSVLDMTIYRAKNCSN